MANGDVTITVAIAGGSVSKAAVIPSASRVKAIARLNNTSDDADLTDNTWAIRVCNSAANGIIKTAEKQLIVDAAPTKPTYTAAS